MCLYIGFNAYALLCDVCCRAAQQQLDFLTTRRQQFVKAALRSKEMKDMQGATQHLRHAKGLDSMITAAKAGLPVDITKVCESAMHRNFIRIGSGGPKSSTERVKFS